MMPNACDTPNCPSAHVAQLHHERFVGFYLHITADGEGEGLLYLTHPEASPCPTGTEPPSKSAPIEPPVGR